MPGLSSISILSLMITDDSEKHDPSLALNLLLGFFFSKTFFHSTKAVLCKYIETDSPENELIFSLPFVFPHPLYLFPSK